MTRPARRKKGTASVIPAQQRLVNTLDVWIIVFEYCNRRTLASAARVWKAWEEPALRALWRHLDDAIPLFRLLATKAVSRHSAVVHEELVNTDDEDEFALNSSESVEYHEGSSDDDDDYRVRLSCQ